MRIRPDKNVVRTTGANVISLSGTAPSADTGLANAEEITADRINAAGGFAIGDTTYKIDFKRQDDGGSVEGGGATITNMVQQHGVHFIGGGFSVRGISSSTNRRPG